jgi:hypothetical protein
MTKHNRFAIMLFVSSMNFQVQAEWGDLLKGAADLATQSVGSELAASTLSNSDAVSGLKEVLANGVESAVTTLGQSGGFLGNQLVEIAAPDSLKTIVATARTLGQGQYIDSFTTSMNQAAEQAVPGAASILGDAIRDMSVADAMNILNGSDDAATQYFRKVSEARLVEKFKPIINQATAQTGVTAAYKNLTGLGSTPLLGGLLGDSSSFDLDQYVTDKSLDGLFTYIAMEEKNIRNNPAARTSDLLKKVFAN